MTKPRKRIYLITHPKAAPITTPSNSPQGACRTAFRYWVKTGQLKRQPKTTDDGGFENVEVEILTK